MVVDGDNFIQQPWAEQERVEKFLDLPHELSEDNFYFNTTKGFFCGRQVLTRAGSVELYQDGVSQQVLKVARS